MIIQIALFYILNVPFLGYGTASIKEVRITPCPEAAQRRPCILRKGTNVTIEVDFEPSNTAIFYITLACFS